MRVEEFEIWVSCVADLNAHQLKQVRVRLSERIQQQTPIRDQLESDWLFTGICEALKSKGLLPVSGAAALPRSKAFRIYQEHAPALRDTLERLLPKPRTRLALHSLAVLVGLCLIEHLERQDLRKSAGIVLLNSRYAMRALDDQFPGYIESGMVPLLLGRRVKEVV